MVNGGFEIRLPTASRWLRDSTLDASSGGSSRLSCLQALLGTGFRAVIARSCAHRVDVKAPQQKKQQHNVLSPTPLQNVKDDFGGASTSAAAASRSAGGAGPFSTAASGRGGGSSQEAAAATAAPVGPAVAASRPKRGRAPAAAAAAAAVTVSYPPPEETVASETMVDDGNDTLLREQVRPQ